MLPKYFNDLHVSVSAITGTPRIVSCKLGAKSTDKYKDIELNEWHSAILNWFSFFKESTSFVQVLKDYTFCIGGKAKDKAQLVKALRDLADTFEKELP